MLNWIDLDSKSIEAGSRRELDVFDNQALVLLLRSLVVLVGTSDDVAEKLLTLLAWSREELTSYQRRVAVAAHVDVRV